MSDFKSPAVLVEVNWFEDERFRKVMEFVEKTFDLRTQLSFADIDAYNMSEMKANGISWAEDRIEDYQELIKLLKELPEIEDETIMVEMNE